jgi:hypothetical protein
VAVEAKLRALAMTDAHGRLEDKAGASSDVPAWKAGGRGSSINKSRRHMPNSLASRAFLVGKREGGVEIRVHGLERRMLDACKGATRIVRLRARLVRVAEHTEC